jgi:6-phosphogluconolactonase
MLHKEIIVLPGLEEMAEYLAGQISEKLATGNDEKSLNIALSGGTTPKLIFEHIVRRYKEQIKWNRIRFFQVDERCVPPDAPESNYRMILHHFLEGLNFPEDQFFRMRGENDPQEEAGRYGKILIENLPVADKWPVFDMILLGMGEDGHTASLFPGDSHVLNSLNYCEVAIHPQTGMKRITLTLPVLNRAKHLVFVVTGRGKAGIVSEIIHNQDKNIYPASWINPGKGTLTWLLDKNAATSLSKMSM